MLEFITKYWIQWLCGLVALGIAYVVKRYFKLEKKDVKDKHDETHKQLKKEINDDLQKEIGILKEEDKVIHEEIKQTNNKLDTLTSGVLSIQGREFKQECRKLLVKDHEITMEEFTQIVDDHEVYNQLGGNSRGDKLFADVEDKWHTQLRK